MRGLLNGYGRALLAAMFVKGGFDALVEPGPRPKAVERAGIPEPEMSVRLNGLGMLVGGVMLALGKRPRLAAVTLAAIVVPTTLVGHPFWSAEAGPQKHQQQIHFLKNLGLLGGLLLVLAES